VQTKILGCRGAVNYIQKNLDHWEKKMDRLPTNTQCNPKRFLKVGQSSFYGGRGPPIPMGWLPHDNITVFILLSDPFLLSCSYTWSSDFGSLHFEWSILWMIHIWMSSLSWFILEWSSPCLCGRHVRMVQFFCPVIFFISILVLFKG